MDHMSYSTFRKSLASVMDRVNEQHAPVIVTRQNNKPAVVMSLEDFNSYEETHYLMSSKNNAARLDQAILELKAGKSIHKEFLD